MNSLPPKSSAGGFTLIELILVIAILVILTLISSFFLQGSAEKRLVYAERDKLLADIDEVRQRAIKADGSEFSLTLEPPNKYMLKPQDITFETKKSVRILEPATNKTITFEVLSGKANSKQNIILGTEKFSAGILINESGLIEAK